MKERTSTTISLVREWYLAEKAKEAQESWNLITCEKFLHATCCFLLVMDQDRFSDLLYWEKKLQECPNFDDALL